MKDAKTESEVEDLMRELYASYKPPTIAKLSALLEIVCLLKAHDPRVLLVRDERGDLAGLGMPLEWEHR